MFWLPPGGFDNGIDASNWAELADLPEQEVASVMFDLAEANVAAYVAMLRHTPIGAAPDQVHYRLWVDSLHYRRAEDLLMEILAQLHHTRPPTPRRARPRRLSERRAHRRCREPPNAG